MKSAGRDNARAGSPVCHAGCHGNALRNPEQAVTPQRRCRGKSTAGKTGAGVRPPKCPYPCCTWLWYTLSSSESRRPSAETSRGQAVSRAARTHGTATSQGDSDQAAPRPTRGCSVSRVRAWCSQGPVTVPQRGLPVSCWPSGLGVVPRALLEAFLSLWLRGELEFRGARAQPMRPLRV